MSSEFQIFLRLMSKKGFYDILKIINKQPLYYNEVLDVAISKKIVSSKASITIILNGLTNLQLLDRSISEQRPIRTTYSITKLGKQVLKNFSSLEYQLK